MISELSLFKEVHKIETISIVLPNGVETLVIKKGTVQLNSKLNLNDVLFVARLNSKLIFISQLSDDNICEVTFTKKICVI